MLGIYVGGIIFCNGTLYIMGSALLKDLKNEGYKEGKKEKNIPKTLLSAMKILGISLIPILNIVFPVVLIANFDELIEITKDGLIEDGSYIKEEEFEDTDESSDIDEEKNNIIMYNVNNQLTRQEKINLLKEELSRLTGKEINIESNNNQLRKRK